MSKNSKKPTLSDLSKDEQILFLGAELIKLKDLLMVTLDQMNRLNSYRNIYINFYRNSYRNLYRNLYRNSYINLYRN